MCFGGLFLKKNIILTLITGIEALIFIRVLRNTSLYFTDKEAITFLNYLSQKDTLFGVSNATIWLFIICSVVVTCLNKVNSIKREG